MAHKVYLEVNPEVELWKEVLAVYGAMVQWKIHVTGKDKGRGQKVYVNVHTSIHLWRSCRLISL